jgi:heme O synthase-like polyprenyltransferase
MKTLFIILSLLLALVAVGSATLDFRSDPNVLALMQRLQYRPGFERSLGLIKVIGALGLVIGLFAHAVGVAAGIGLAVYFLLAIRAHFKVADPVKDAIPAFALFVLSVMTVVVGVLS